MNMNNLYKEWNRIGNKSLSSAVVPQMRIYNTYEYDAFRLKKYYNTIIL